jgi:hypothetical protein
MLVATLAIAVFLPVAGMEPEALALPFRSYEKPSKRPIKAQKVRLIARNMLILYNLAIATDWRVWRLEWQRQGWTQDFASQRRLEGRNR